MEELPKEEKQIFDFSEEALITAMLEKSDPKKIWTLIKALQATLSERGLEETDEGDWVDKKTNQLIVDGSLFYELLTKASEHFLERRSRAKVNIDEEYDLLAEKEKEILRQEQHFLKGLEKPRKNWYQTGQYE